MISHHGAIPSGKSNKLKRMGNNIRPILTPIKMNDSYIIPSRGLKLIGIRFYPYDGQNGEDERKAMCIQKSLYNKTKWFYFNKGFTIDEDGDEIKQIKVDEHAFDSSSLLYSVPMGMHISVL